MSEIKLTRRYPDSRPEDITDAYMRGMAAGMEIADSQTVRRIDPAARAASLGEEIVRCRDCKHATPDTSGRKRYEGYLWCDELTEGIGFSVAPSDFCAWGERK